MQKYHSHIQLPRNLTIDDAASIIEKIRGVASAEVIDTDDYGFPLNIFVTFEEEDGWDLSQTVRDLQDDIVDCGSVAIKIPKPLPFREEETHVRPAAQGNPCPTCEKVTRLSRSWVKLSSSTVCKGFCTRQVTPSS